MCLQIMEKAFERDSMIGCSIPPEPNVVEAELPSGLIAGHAYSVTMVKKVRNCLIFFLVIKPNQSLAVSFLYYS